MLLTALRWPVRLQNRKFFHGVSGLGAEATVEQEVVGLPRGLVRQLGVEQKQCDVTIGLFDAGAV